MIPLENTFKLINKSKLSCTISELIIKYLKLLNLKWYVIKPKFKKSIEYSIVIISNQGGIIKKKTDLKSVQEKLDAGCDLIRNSNIPVIIFFGSDFDNYRKPYTGIWRELLNLSSLHNSNYLDKLKKHPYDFIYVGDAAGRVKTKKYKKDFSVSDRMFAFNIKAKFFTPEEFIGEESREWSWNNKLYPLQPLQNTFSLNDIDFKKTPEMIIMVGYPGSGKSTLSQSIFKKYKYEILNMDTLKTNSKFNKELKICLKENKSVIIDNTNSSIKNRKKYIDLAQEYNYHVKCIWMDVELELAYHLNQMRTEITGRKTIPKVAYYTYRKYFQEPTLNEGINDIIKVPFFLKKNNPAFWRHYN